jgi:hypothetical protein
LIIFEHFFKEVDFNSANDSGEVAVACPFPHTTNDGKRYYETNPSAHINTEKSLYHCKVCGEKHSEASFLVSQTNLAYGKAVEVIDELQNHNITANWEIAVNALKTNSITQSLIKKLKFSKEAVDFLRIGFEGEGISYPVYVYGQLMDVRKYRPGQQPKVMSRSGAKAGYIIPDLSYMKDLETVYICAGEKDMTIARSNGFDAFTLTGGEMAIPHTYGYAFRGKKVYILYDNDKTGLEGAFKLGLFLKEQGAIPYVVTGHHATCVEKGEDIWDFFGKYNKTSDDLKAIVDATEPMTSEQLKKEFEKEYPFIPLENSVEPQYRNKYVTALVQVVGVYNNTFGIPEVIEVEKLTPTDTRPQVNVIPIGTKKLFTVDDTNIEDVLYLMDSNLKEDQVRKNILGLAKIPSTEVSVAIKYKAHATVYKSTIVNYGASKSAPIEIDVYSKHPLENGKKYTITFKPVQHPLRQQEIVLIAKRVQGMDNTLENFELNDDVKGSLKVFQVGKDVNEGMEMLFQYDKGYVGGEADRNITQTVDLVYNTPLQIKVGKSVIRGTLDAFMVGETRTGKSHTSKVKRELYDMGSVINLGTTTVAGLIGGTNKATNKTKIGLLPREHKNLVIMEEFSSMKDNAFIKSMTEIRSSNEVRIVRVDTDIRVPCQLRMLTISNPKSRQGGAGRSMKSYPNGIEVLLELIDSPEDIARYDFFTLVPEPEEYISFMDKDYEKLPEISYRNRVRWAWTRRPEQIIMDTDTQKYLWQKSVDLNREYNTHVRLFGTEAWQKIARIAVASAIMLVSTDATFENVVVTKQHIDWAVSFLIRIYDNNVFKLKQFVGEQRKYSEVDDELVKELQELYLNNATLFNFLEMSSGVPRAVLRDVSGKSNEDFSVILNEMSRLYLFRWSGSLVIPSERLRKGLSKINRNIRMKGSGNSVL